MAVLSEDAMTVGAAARFLGVTESHVQHLGRTGQVTYVARGLLDGASVRGYRAARQGTRTRAWSGGTAWAAISLLSGRVPEWIGQAQLSRLRTRLRSVDGSDLVAATRNRARVRRFAGHESAAGRIRADQQSVELTALQGLSDWQASSGVQAYVAEGAVDDLARSFRLQSDVRGDFVLHEVCSDGQAPGAGVPIDLVGALMEGQVLPALDAATSEDPRERGLALTVLEESLGRFVDNG